MDKWLCWASMGVAGLLLLLFILDIFVGIPFGRFIAVDIFGAMASTLVLLLALDASRDLH